MDKIIATYYYKGHKIERIENRWRQQIVVVDGDTENWYVSLADAKRAINGLPTLWVAL